MNFACPYCNANLESDDSTAGTTVQCPACGNVFIVPRVAIPAARIVTPNHALQSNNKKLLTWFSVKGRATRSEFWAKFGINFGVSFIIGFIEGFLLATLPNSRQVVWNVTLLVIILWIAYIPLCIDMIMTNIRRFHDLNITGWWLLLPFGISLLGVFLRMMFKFSNNYSIEEYIYAVVLFQYLIPSAINIVYLIKLGCYAGTHGPNKYGLNPRG